MPLWGMSCPIFNRVLSDMSGGPDICSCTKDEFLEEKFLFNCLLYN